MTKLTPSEAVYNQSLPISCRITSSETQNFTEYIILVRHGFGSVETKWEIRRRYNDFDRLHSDLSCAGLQLDMPPKQLVGNKRPEFVAARRVALQKLLDQITRHILLVTSCHFARFLCPDNWEDSGSSSTEAVAIALRNLKGWTVKKQWKYAGCRHQKSYFLVQSVQLDKRSDMLSWIETSNWCRDTQPADALQSVLEFVRCIKHPYILSPMFTWANDHGALLIYPYLPDGMLRDQFCKVRPEMPYLKKFVACDTVYPLSLDDIRHVGRHILEALHFLKKLGVPYANLHASNLAVLSSGCALTDVESGLLGHKSSYYWQLIIQLKAIQSLEQIDVYCFAHTLFELATGDTLMQPTLPQDAKLRSLHPTTRELLMSLLSPEAIDAGLPSIEHLMAHELFASVPVRKQQQNELVVPVVVREWCSAATQHLLQSLQQHQLAYSQAARSIKVSAYINSDEHRKERRKAARQGNFSATLKDIMAPIVTLPPPALTNQHSVSTNEHSASTSRSELTNENGDMQGVPRAPPPPPVTLGTNETSGNSGVNNHSVVIPPPPPAPPVNNIDNNMGEGARSGRTQMLEDIRSFKKNKLSHATRSCDI